MNDNDEWITMMNEWQWWMNGNDELMTTMNELQGWMNNNVEWMTMMNELHGWVNNNVELMTMMNEWQSRPYGFDDNYELQDKCMTTIWMVNDNGKWITMINELQGELMTTMNEWKWLN